ncbi:MAG: DUF5060 domain-containing protein [Clostridiales bacterium]|nr:DUF5060 domain-containing protein [Clostridiales bacterium]
MKQLTVERWGLLELSLPGRTGGNPFTDYEIRGRFTGEKEDVTVSGFYDGNGIWKIRFMPSFSGAYRYTVSGTFAEAESSGFFTVMEPSARNHGPVRIAGEHHFAYADGTPFYPLGTTCYVWTQQPDSRIEETLRSLKEARFNKIRFCILPKHYDYNLGEPRTYPFEGTPMDSSVLTKENFWEFTGKAEGNHFDLTRPNPAHFQHLEKCILALQNIGVEADLIVMHPYDRWGFSCMPREADDLYWRYVIARFAAFRNVWWSLANEYDLLKAKTEEDWEHYADLLVRNDPYGHLRSIHNCIPFYDHTRPWITHCSIQRQDLYRGAEYTDEWRERYGKPVVLDEIAYEGNIQHGWGNLTGEEMVRRFWEGAVRGGYPGHGETFLNPEDILWWSHGGKLHGESWKRIGFLLDVLAGVPGRGLRCLPAEWDSVCGVPEDPELAERTGYRLYYYSFMRPSFRDFRFDDSTLYHAEVIDTWNMTVTDAGDCRGRFRVELPARPYMAVRITKR